MAQLNEMIEPFNDIHIPDSSTKLPLQSKWLSLFFFTRPRHAFSALFAALTATSAGLLVPAFAIFLGKLFNSFTDSGSGTIPPGQLQREVSENCLMLVGLAVATWILSASYYSSWIAFGELQANSARATIFNSLVGKDLAWYDTREEGIGAFLVQVERQIRDLQIATSQPLGTSLQFLVRMLAALGLSLYTSPKLASVTLAGVPVFMILIILFTTKIHQLMKQQQNGLADASRVVHDSICGIDTVKCLNAQACKYGQYSSRIRIAAYFNIKQARFNALRISFNDLMMFSMFIQGFWYGSILVRSSQVSAGDVVRTFWACMTAIQSLAQILNNAATLEKGKVAGSALKAIFKNNLGSSLQTTPGRPHPPDFTCKGEVCFENVSFCYPTQPEILALNSVNLDFNAGKTTFIVGPSGSGKSTVGNLISLFYSSFLGRISIDGMSIRTIGIDWLRGNITLIHQQSHLFNETLLRNIAFGLSNPTDLSTGIFGELQAALRTANLFDVIRTLPQGLNTLVSAGSTLSGGQKQRVAIARARLRNSAILILDECTSALDQTNRVAVMREIRRWRKGKTTIIVTHDLDQVFEEDFVYVLTKGGVVRSGYKKELIDFGELNFKSAQADNYAESISRATSSSSRMEIEESTMEFFPEYLADTLLSPKPCISEGTKRYASLRIAYDKELPPLPSPLNEATLRSYENDIQVDGSGLKIGCPSQIRSRGSNSWSSRTDSKPFPRSQISIARRLASRIFPAHSMVSFKNKRGVDDDVASLPFIRILHCTFTSLRPKRRGILILGLSSAIIHGAAYPIFSFLLSGLLRTFYRREYNFSEIAKWPLAIIGVGLCDALAAFLMNYLLEDCGQRWVNTLRKEAMRRMLGQPRSWFDLKGNDASRLSSILDRNAEETRAIMGRFVGYILVASTLLCLALLLSLCTSWKLTIVIIACVPVMFVITICFRKVSEKWESRCNEMNEKISSIFSETFADIRTVKTFTLGPYFRSKLVEKLREAWRLGLKRAVYSGMFFGLSQSMMFFLSALLFYYGAVLIASEQVTIADMFTVFTVLLFSLGYASLLLSWIPQYSSARDTASHLIRLSRLPVGKSHESQGRLRIFNPLPICFDHVHFHYQSRPEYVVLRDLSFTIPPNTCAALVGPSGCGKSTVASLLLRLYELSPHNGEELGTITLGSVDIRNLHVSSLRSRICLVPQQPQIFTDTIHHNIAYGLDLLSSVASLANIRAAAKRAGIDDFIMSLPEAYSTLVGNGGVVLSGGQAQQLAIARALVRQPQVLILDEATSSLDHQSAKVIRETIQEHIVKRGDLTVIMITHDWQMMQMADRVIVIQQGTVVEEGAYQVLRHRKGGALRQMLATT